MAERLSPSATGVARRQFARTLAGAAAASLAAQAPPQRRPLIGIQFGAVSLTDEGVEPVLDIFEQRAAVNVLFPAVYSYSNGTAGRQARGHPFPGHGKNEYDTNFRGGNFARVHAQYYKNTAIDPRATQAPDHPGFDILAELTPAAHKRGMRVICLVQDSFAKDLANLDQLQEMDFNGQRAETACKNNPHFRNFMLGLVEDLLRSYDVDGILLVNEQQGAFSDTLGSRFRGRARGRPGARTCFCGFCRRKGEQQGIRFDRVQRAFAELEKFVAAGRSRKRPADGYYVTLWRLMLGYPELLAWEHLYHESLRELYRDLHRQVKTIRPAALFGPHIWHNASMSPIFRAEQDFAALAGYSDFVKLALYHNCGGPRLASYIDSVGETIYGDVPRDELLRFHYRVLNYDEAPYEQLRNSGLSSDYVFRETKRAVEATRGTNTLILPGIDVDIPVREDDLRGAEPGQPALATRASARNAAEQAFRAGSHGILISRKYSEMRLDTLSGVGDAIRGLGLKT